MKVLTHAFPLLFGLLFIVVLLAACTSSPPRVQMWGSLGDKPGQFNEPFDIAVDQQGFVYVTDARNKRAQKFTADGHFLMAFGANLFEKPSGIAIAPDATVWITDYDLDKVFHFNGQGQLISVWGEAGNKVDEFESPVDIAVNSEDLVYVVDQYHHRIQVFSPDGHFIRTWGKQGKVNVVRSALNFIVSEGHDSEFYYPSRIAIGPGNNVYISDAYNNRVQVFDSTGHFLHSIGGMGFWSGRFRVTSGLAVSPDGSLFVADFYNNRIQHFDKIGNYLNAWQGKSGRGEFNGPTGVAVAPGGSILVTDWGNHRIQKIIPQ